MVECSKKIVQVYERKINILMRAVTVKSICGTTVSLYLREQFTKDGSGEAAKCRVMQPRCFKSLGEW